MKFGTALSAIAIVALVAVAGAQGKLKNKMAPKPMTKAQWQSNYNEAAKLFEAKNADAIFKYMAPDFTMTMMGQKMNAAQSKTSMKQWFGMVKDLHCKMTVTGVTSKGGMTMVTDSYSMWGTMTDPKTHKTGKYTDKGTETATWVQMNGKWMMKSMVSNAGKMTFNGKPWNPKM